MSLEVFHPLQRFRILWERYQGASLIAQLVKNLPAMQETWFRSLGQEDPLEKEMATHSNTRAWRIPWAEEPGWCGPWDHKELEKEEQKFPKISRRKEIIKIWAEIIETEIWTVAYQAPLSMGFSRQECWSGLPFPSPGDLPDPGIEPGSPTLQANALPSEPPGKLKRNNSKD